VHEPAVVNKDSQMNLLDIVDVRSNFNFMSQRYTDVAEKALTLPQSEQLRLARTLLEKAEAAGEVGSDAAWEEEIERRIQRIDAGLANGRPFADVLRDVDARFGK